MTTAELRQQFLDFFASKGHEILASSSLVPGNDPTLLFTNAGMVQFKDVFLGMDQRPYNRATTSQRCVRAGGKHNDLENVGYTARHHTFFEMLGNFSFGDYFKEDAIKYAWEFLTEVLKLPKGKLWVTVYAEDDEAYNIWTQQMGIPLDRITRIGDNKGSRYASDNFWQMGDTGPCGPCTEIFYDHGEHIWGGPPGTPEEDGDRYIEIWNLVFMQYERTKDGEMRPLPKPSVDTGMGMERLAAVMQSVHSNYEIDLFQTLLKKAASLAPNADPNSPSLKVIADHIRSCSFLITDGVLPSNEGRGYVLRRIIRRAIRHGYKLSMAAPFFHKLVQPLVDEMGKAYPELAAAQTQVEQALEKEERRFAETLEHGMKVLEEAIGAMSGDTIDGETVFKLYDTYGFPVDLTGDIARERNLKLDEAGFEAAMDAQRERARAAGKFGADYGDKLDVSGATEFHGYEQLAETSTIAALFRGSEAVSQMQAGDEGRVVLDHTPFYAESGGQVGDTGVLHTGDAVFRVSDTRKQGATFIHIGKLESGTLSFGASVTAEVDAERRQAIILNHSATHLMHAALRQVLGTHVEQKGSLVTPERLRFDFSQPDPVSAEQIAEVEAIVNREIRANAATSAQVMGMEDAKKAGAMALFGEKYGDEVRVLKIGFSTELCSGCHVNRSGDIGLFKIVSEGGVAAGIRRIEAVTGANALAWLGEVTNRLDHVARLLKSNPTEVADKLDAMLQKSRALEKELEQLKGKMASQAGSSLADQAVEVGGMRVLAANLEGADPKSLRDTVDQLKNKLGKAVVILATVADGKVSLVAGVTKDETAKVKAGDLLGFVAGKIGGKGGGRPDMAQGGGTDVAALPAALAAVQGWVAERV
ncbi:MAG TPA: alanine--tRNA ligase [Candidatus Thiothrix moscowensis]|uniref:alanine--tRNA ligase n=1 Tax=unclassified Thiothrix TaxID=2636184 RepID=UPI0025E50B5C|nr:MULTISPECIES: alanine--tRNA ligase [unclassified Thiothrix]HRJ53203.1 alanine--tRNA ligase [Candidatus Thiothrix moscowensis]HRJ93227.1 alanine--tRNA ligase [Candidatus Thiothrix moscowensis]